MPLFTFILRITRQTALAIFLLILPLSAYCVANQLSDRHSNESSRGIARISDPHVWLSHEERATLETRLGEFWNRTGLKVSVLIDSPPDARESLDSYSERIAKRWGLIGQSGTPGGILLVIDPQEKRAALSVSSELVKDFPSGSIERIIHGNINPMLMHGKLASGIGVGIERISVFLEQPNHFNRSLFARGQGALVLFAIFIAGMILRRIWGPLRSALAAAVCFGALVCLDGFNLDFAWYEVLFGAALSSVFLGLFVWIGLGNDTSTGTTEK